MLVGLIMFSCLIVLLATGMPIAAALGLIGITSLTILKPALLHGVSYSIWSSSTSFVLSAVPLFIMLGEIVLRAGLSLKFYRALSLWLKWLPGGLLHTNIAACSLFAAISGSSVGTAAAIGSVAIPEFKKLGYDKGIVYGSLAAGGTLGILIPPSLGLIINGSLVEDSIGTLFIAGLIPGILMALLFMAYIAIHAKLNPSIVPETDTSEKVGLREKLFALKDILPIIIIMVVMLGGLYLGWATPTEAAALGVFIAILVSIMYRGFNWSHLMESAAGAARTTAMVLFVILGAQIFSFALYKWGATYTIAKAVVGLSLNSLSMWMMIVVFYIILGMFIDAISMVVLTLMVVHPIIIKLGFDSIWFGVTLTLICEIGLITPPVGMNLYAIQSVAQEPSIMVVIRGAFPFVLLLILGIILLTAFPGLALWLPSRI